MAKLNFSILAKNDLKSLFPASCLAFIFISDLTRKYQAASENKSPHEDKPASHTVSGSDSAKAPSGSGDGALHFKELSPEERQEIAHKVVDGVDLLGSPALTAEDL